MQFTSKLTGLLMITAASAMSVQALAAAPRDAEAQQAALSVTFFDQQFLDGKALSPEGLQDGASFNLPEDWLDRPRSLFVSSGYVCGFFTDPDSQGAAVFLSGINHILPPSIDEGIESFTCFKTE